MACCYIIGAGSMFAGDLDFVPGQEDLVIAADGGYQYLQQAGIVPHLLIGDFDSMSRPNVSCETIVLPVEKDDTDVGYAIKEGFARGYTQFVIYGGLGGDRLSHTFANLQLLQYIHTRGGSGQLVGGGTRMFVLEHETHRFAPEETGHCSVFALTPQATVTLEGMQYPLNRQTITSHFPLGVSNRLVECAAIRVHEGMALVITEREGRPTGE